MKVLLSLLVIATFSKTTFAKVVTSQVFKKGSSRKELLYNFKNTITETNEQQSIDAQYTDLAGNIVVTEKAERKDDRIKRYEIDHRQTGRKGSIVVEGKQVFFNFEENNKKKPQKVEDLKDNFIVNYTLVAFVSKHWQTLNNGDSVDARFGVWDRQETFGFSFSKVGEETLDGQKVVLIKFKPSSFLVAALVDPIIFKFTPDGKELVSLVGRVVPKQKSGNSWVDLDAEVIYKTVTP